MPASIRNSSLCCLVAAILLMAGGLAAAQPALPLSSDGQVEPLLTVERSGWNVIGLRLSLDALDTRIVETSKGSFVQLAAGDYGFTREVGHPQLPVMREFIEIPYGAAYGVELIEPLIEEYALSELGLDAPLYPAQPPLPKSQTSGQGNDLIIDAQAYATDADLLVSQVRIAEEVVMRGRRLLVLEICPVDYNPVAGTLKVLRSAKLAITLSGADMAATTNRIQSLSSPRFDSLIHEVVLNASAFEAPILSQTRTTGRGIGYLIISDPSFMSNAKLTEFVNLRTSQGFDVTLVDTNTTGTSTSSIKNYIQNAYNTWSPEYVLLVGDTNTIPRWTGSGSYSPATDLNYACVDGLDYIPDVSRGRFPVRTSTELTNLCSKIISMASNQVKKAVFMASEDRYTVSEGTHNNVISYYLQPDGWTSDKLYCHTYNASTSQVRSSFNGGRSVGCFSGHGSETYWADGPTFYQSDVRGLTNTIYPMVLSFSCLTGSYHITEAFCETWVRDDHGATSFFGASESSYWDEDDVLEKRIFRGWFDYSHDRVGTMLDYGQYELYLWMGTGSFSRMYYEMYNLMGEPSMKVLDSGGGSLPVCDIKIDGQDGPLFVPASQTVTITLNLDCGSQLGVPHDWWIFTLKNWSQYYSFSPPQRWTPVAAPVRSYNGALFEMNNYTLAQSKIPMGSWTFTFAVDTLNNVFEGTSMDTIDIQTY